MEERERRGRGVRVAPGTGVVVGTSVVEHGLAAGSVYLCVRDADSVCM